VKSVLCFGEALVDIFTTGHHCEGKLSLPNYRQYPGGAPANAAVAVARLGGRAKFIGQVGADPFGHFLIDALNSYGVDTSLTRQTERAQTALAFVFLDESGERSFAFYRNQTADLLLRPEHIDRQCFDDNSIMHFCSNTLTDSGIAQTTEYVVHTAGEAGTLISFDVNLRHNLWPEKKAEITAVNKLCERAHILKYTREELLYLAGGNDEAYLEILLSNKAQLILITDGEQQLRYYTKNSRGSVTPPRVAAVDSTGAGDAFIGSLLYGISRLDNLPTLLDRRESLEALLAFCTHCGAHTVSRLGVFPALPEMDDVQQYWTEL
jgi:fructokinase